MYGKQNNLIEFSIIGFDMNYKSSNKLKKTYHLHGRTDDTFIT